MDRTLYVALTVLLVVAQASLLWRLFRVGVAREYSFFVALIVWVLAASGGLWVVLQVEGNGLIYGKAWLTNEFLICAAALCALLEIFNILLAQRFRNEAESEGGSSWESRDLGAWGEGRADSHAVLTRK